MELVWSRISGGSAFGEQGSFVWCLVQASELVAFSVSSTLIIHPLQIASILTTDWPMEEDFGGAMAEANTAGLVINSQHIAKFAVRSDPRPLAATSVTLAYGNWAIPKLVLAINSYSWGIC